MSDRVTQVVLGVFAGIVTYCIIVLRTIRGGDGEDGFVPSLAVAFSVVLAIGGMGTLILFIHHIASSIQASSIIASVTKETLEAVDRLFPERSERGQTDDEGDPPLLPSPAPSWQVVMAERNGYLQSVDFTALLRLAREHKSIVRMERRIGEFVVENTPLASIAMESPPDHEVMAELRAAYLIDRYRTVRPDCAFGIRQLVDMAVARALTRHQRHHDGRDVRGLFDGDSGASRPPGHRFVAPRGGRGNAGDLRRADLRRPGGRILR